MPRTLAIVSGKGGVGKSVLAVNLAETMAEVGYRVGLVDADAGQSACPVLLNACPPVSVADVAGGRAAPGEALFRTASGVTLMQAASEPSRGGAERGAPALVAALDAGLDALRAASDVVLIDAPAGAGPLVRWAMDRAGAALLVLVGEPTAVADAYALAKLVWSADPGFPLGAVVNFADTEAEAESVAARFAAVAEPFLGQAPPYLGWVPYCVTVRQSVRAQTPAVRAGGAAQAAFRTLAAEVLRPWPAVATP
ncbi:MAG: P-loop NTPase [Rubricoccaceae bacterium]